MGKTHPIHNTKKKPKISRNKSSRKCTSPYEKNTLNATVLMTLNKSHHKLILTATWWRGYCYYSSLLYRWGWGKLCDPPEVIVRGAVSLQDLVWSMSGLMWAAPLPHCLLKSLNLSLNLSLPNWRMAMPTHLPHPCYEWNTKLKALNSGHKAGAW